MKATIAVSFIVCTLLFPLQPAQAERADIYQYTDDKGVVHFTNFSGSKNLKRVKAEPLRPERVTVTPTPVPSRQSADVAPSTPMPTTYRELIHASCARHGVDPALVHAIVKVESDFNPYAVSRKGAMGLMQLMPQTAVDLNVQNSFNPTDNIDGGVKYLRYLMDRYEGNLSLALAAYNSGESAVKKWGTIPPFKETQNYVQRILKIYNTNSKVYVPRYTIYMGYSEDGSLIFTDTPPARNKKTPQKKGKTL